MPKEAPPPLPRDRPPERTCSDCGVPVRRGWLVVRKEGGDDLWTRARGSYCSDRCLVSALLGGDPAQRLEGRNRILQERLREEEDRCRELDRRLEGAAAAWKILEDEGADAKARKEAEGNLPRFLRLGRRRG